MARYGVNATYNLWIRSLKSVHETYFSANIRLVRRLFTVNVCYNYIVSKKYYYENLGSADYGRNVNSNRYWLQTLESPTSYLTFEFHSNECRFGNKYPALFVEDIDNNISLSYLVGVAAGYFICWSDKKFKVTRTTNGQKNKLFSEEIDIDNYEFNDCFQLIYFMLKKAKYFQN